MARWDDAVRYRVAPPLFLVFFPAAAQVLALWGAAAEAEEAAAAVSSAARWRDRLLGNGFSWAAVAAFLLWAYLWQRLTSATTTGPTAPYGEAPMYKANGVLYYWVSLAAFFLAQAWWPGLSLRLHASMPQVLATLNVCALLLCGFLFAAPQAHPGDAPPDGPPLYQFFTGRQLHPRLLGVDVKQFTNCRVGLMAWQLLVIAFYIAGVSRNGFSAAALVNMLLQSVYIAKFFWWEAGYFGTLDMTLDRAGYYICWGCLVWVPGLYTFSSYYLVAHPPVLGAPAAAACALLGVAAVLLNYRVDYEKQVFRASEDGRCELWGRPAQFLEVRGEGGAGSSGRRRRLLVSGCWGLARHLNYTFELLAALAWSLPCWGLGAGPFLYVAFLLVLLLHRAYRDEEKCAARYGDVWRRYCRLVPCRLLPHVY